MNTGSISADTVHEVLSNSRRRMTLEFLREQGSLTHSELSELIAEAETGESPPPRNIRRSVYVSLQQTHLPKLDDENIVVRDDSTDDLVLGESVDDVAVYLEVVPERELAWSEFIAGVCMLGVLLVVAEEVGVPFLSALDSPMTLAMLFGVLFVASVWQRETQRIR